MWEQSFWKAALSKGPVDTLVLSTSGDLTARLRSGQGGREAGAWREMGLKYSLQGGLFTPIFSRLTLNGIK